MTDSKNDDQIVKNVSGKLKLVVGATDAIIIIGDDMGIKMVIPELQEGDPVPNNAVLISAIATRLNMDPSFTTDLMKFLEDYGRIDEHGITSVMGEYNGQGDDPMDTTSGITWN